MTTVPEILSEAAELYAERNELYGDNYQYAGEALAAMFPRGLTVKTSMDWNRLCLFIHCFTKLSRYAQNMEDAPGHKDSARDLCVYAAMLEEMTP